MHEVDGLLGGGGRRDPVAAAPQGLAQHGQYDGLVVDHEHLVPVGTTGVWARGTAESAMRRTSMSRWGAGVRVRS